MRSPSPIGHYSVQQTHNNAQNTFSMRIFTNHPRYRCAISVFIRVFSKYTKKVFNRGFCPKNNLQNLVFLLVQPAAGAARRCFRTINAISLCFPIDFQQKCTTKSGFWLMTTFFNSWKYTKNTFLICYSIFKKTLVGRDVVSILPRLDF